MGNLLQSTSQRIFMSRKLGRDARITPETAKWMDFLYSCFSFIQHFLNTCSNVITKVGAEYCARLHAVCSKQHFPYSSFQVIVGNKTCLKDERE